jgi:tRNA (adenine57-N1/adenine58-N1)-methyltransferase
MTTAEAPKQETTGDAFRQISPFLRAPEKITVPTTVPSIIHLRRDNHQALVLKANTPGTPPSILQTRFGEFPHSSFINQPYGAQVRASAPQNSSRKRKRPGTTDSASPTPATTETDLPQPAAAGFLHVLAPTAELWTASLPHRTQVVYTPDSSYILHRLNVHPGTCLIEAGAGSGSFSHAAVRAIYSGYPDNRDLPNTTSPPPARTLGKVYSYEFHHERAEKLRVEIAAHNLDGLIEITHKDVCASGFLLPSTSPRAHAIFLDLPAPWLALPHLVRAEPSPLDPDHEVRICTFSPCIEQVTRTVATLRELGWVDITTVEISHQRIEVRRQAQRGYDDGGAGPRTVAEALQRLKAVNQFREARKEVQSSLLRKSRNDGGNEAPAKSADIGFKKEGGKPRYIPGPEEGRIITRNEPEIKTHTSYLTFACLPREWTQEMEENASAWVKEKISSGKVTAVVGEKERKWKGEGASASPGGTESRRAKKRRERAEKVANGEDLSCGGTANPEDGEKIDVDT